MTNELWFSTQPESRVKASVAIMRRNAGLYLVTPVNMVRLNVGHAPAPAPPYRRCFNWKNVHVEAQPLLAIIPRLEERGDGDHAVASRVWCFLLDLQCCLDCSLHSNT
jgi:hypothetical protein